MGIRNFDSDPCEGFSKSAVEEALEHLLNSRKIHLSERNRKFLHFVVQETIHGRGGRIKAYSVGVDVFGRSEDFDPNIDPIVRIEATRLRSALEAYYNGPGIDDAVRIILRPGSYMPAFEGRLLGTPVNCRPTSSKLRSSTQKQAVVVTHMTDLRDKSALARGALLVNALVHRLVEERFRVFPIPHSQQGAAIRKVEEIVGNVGTIYALEIAVHQIAEGKRYAWSVSNCESGELRGLGDIDQADEGMPSAAMVSALAETAFHSILPMMA